MNLTFQSIIPAPLALSFSRKTTLEDSSSLKDNRTSLWKQTSNSEDSLGTKARDSCEGLLLAVLERASKDRRISTQSNRGVSEIFTHLFVRGLFRKSLLVLHFDNKPVNFKTSIRGGSFDEVAVILFQRILHFMHQNTSVVEHISIYFNDSLMTPLVQFPHRTRGQCRASHGGSFDHPYTLTYEPLFRLASSSALPGRQMITSSPPSSISAPAPSTSSATDLDTDRYESSWWPIIIILQSAESACLFTVSS